MTQAKTTKSHFARMVWLIAFATITHMSARETVAANFVGDAYQADLREIALLPRYCIYTQLYRARVPGGNSPSEIGRWTALLGDTFQHLHHWCAGLIWANRALIHSSGNKTYNLEESVREYDYVIQRAPAEFVLLPEMLTRKGENLLLLGRAADGTAALIRAIELKPDYWPPYAVMSDYFRKLKNFGAAREWLQKGLAVAPGTEPLRRRLMELPAGDGK